jgi:CheY-like chemotaxis protein
MMGGEIRLESELGRGSTFLFTARFGRASESDVPERKVMPATIDDARVLVVDDNATNRRILEENLRRWGTEPDAVASAEQALHQLSLASENGAPYRLVLTDVHMPDVDGFMLARKIRQDSQWDATPIMMLTSGGEPEDRSRCEQLKIASYLMKPVKPSELFDELLVVLGHSSKPQEVSQTELLPAAAPRRRLQILLVEDSLMNQKLAVAILSKAGHQVTIASNGRESLDVWQSETFDVILMDIQMPEMDGLQATRAIRSQERSSGGNIPIIAMTANAIKGDRERCLEAGMNGYLSKPIHIKELLETLDSISEGLESEITDDGKVIG